MGFPLGMLPALPSPLLLLSFVFLQLYHSPFFGDESNKPILLPNEVGTSTSLTGACGVGAGLAKRGRLAAGLASACSQTHSLWL